MDSGDPFAAGRACGKDVDLFKIMYLAVRETR